jgi:hypothetical protein
MAAIDISGTSVPLNNGILQLQNGVAMSATAVFVTDQLNTPSILKLSTNLVQINGALNFPKSYTTFNEPNIFITTQTQPDPNNFAVQKSVTTSIGTTYVQNGVEPLETGYGNTYVGLGSNAMGAGNSYFNTMVGANTTISVSEPGNVVIGYAATSSAANALAIGRNASVSAFNGSALGYLSTTSTTNGFALGNSSSLLQIGGNFVPTARVHVKGLGATSATTSLLIQNSASNSALTIKDDLTSTFGGSVSVGATIVASAILQADSTTKGLLPPRMTTTQINAIVSPAEGLVAYNTTISHLCCYQSGSWVKFNHSPM